MIKYLGSKRRLIPVLEDLFVRSGACTGLDMFTGTTRVARSFKAAGAHVTAVDMTRYAEVLARCYIATDADLVDSDRLAAEVARLVNNQGLIAIAALVAPKQEVRARARELVGGDRFVEVFVDTPLEVCRERDENGMYEAADRGEIPQFPGVSATYDRPTDMDLRVATSVQVPSRFRNT